MRGGLKVDGDRVRLRAPPRTSILINELRRLLDVELSELIDSPELSNGGSICFPARYTLHMLKRVPCIRSSQPGGHMYAGAARQRRQIVPFSQMW